MSDYLRWLVILISGTILGACAHPYKPPMENEPHALLKLKYSYNSILPQATLHVRATVKEGKNEHQSALQIAPPVFGNEVPLQTILIRPGIDTEIGTWLGFLWEEIRYYTDCDKDGKCRRTLYTNNEEKGCQQMTRFIPKEGKIYLLDYNNPNVDKGCDAKIYEQIPQTDGKFKLKPVGF